MLRLNKIAVAVGLRRKNDFFAGNRLAISGFKVGQNYAPRHSIHNKVMDDY